MLTLVLSFVDQAARGDLRTKPRRSRGQTQGAVAESRSYVQPVSGISFHVNVLPTCTGSVASWCKWST